jgi:hypothetical protein
MRAALEAAWSAGWTSFVLVLHSSDLILDRKLPRPHGHPDRAVIRRFEALCDYLAENPRYRTTGVLARATRRGARESRGRPVRG